MIEFILNNSLIRTEVKSGMTLLHFIREVQGLKGTKSGCKEGDCGACTVLSGALQKNNSVVYKSITSCLSPLANAHGKHIVSVEGVNLKTELNVSQKAIKDNFATQCGFCTPGFVNSLVGFALQNNSVTENDGLNAISGNICRCTGYKSLKKAVKDVSKKRQESIHTDNLAWLVENKFIPDYFTTIPNRLKKLGTTKIQSEGVLVAGGTDLYVRHADALLDENIQSGNDFVSNDINFKDNICAIGVGATVSDLLDNEYLQTYFPNLAAHLKLVSSEPIRNMASLGGNFVNASPIGDMSIFFLALNARLKIQNSIGETREIPFKDFFIDYKKYDLKNSEFIQNLAFELPDKNTFFNFEKVSKRTHLDIASVNAAISINVKDGIIMEAHVAVGGVAAIPKYCHKTSLYLSGKELTSAIILESQEMMQSEILPISDVRGTDNYKRLLARQLFFAHFVELFPNLFKLKDLVV